MISIFRVSGQSETEAAGSQERDIKDLMPWSAKLETGIDDIDAQHRELVRLVNLLHRGMRLQKGTDEVGAVLNDLAEYTVNHFKFEEDLFETHEYPETNAHKKIHEDLVGQVTAFQSEFKTGKATVSMDLMDFLKDWLNNHILKTDMAYAPYIIQKMEAN